MNEELQKLNEDAQEIGLWIRQKMSEKSDCRPWITAMCASITTIIAQQNDPKAAFKMFLQAVDLMQETVNRFVDDV